jgi:S-DNA-T family DNA segregation ATPase FtsK/SpoIIIE
LGYPARLVVSLIIRASHTATTRSAPLRRIVGSVLTTLAARLWRGVGPAVLDGWGWLVYRAPGLAWRGTGRLSWRLIRWLPGAILHLLWWSLVGLWFLVRHTARYCIGYHDFAAVVQDARDRAKPRQELLWRRRWRQAATRRTLTMLVIGAVLCVLVVELVHRFGRLAEAGLTIALVVVLACIGRASRPPTPRDDTPDEDGSDDPLAPFPLADARTRAEAADTVTRALAAEGIDIRLAEEPTRAMWGWTVPVVLRQGTPAAVVSKAGNLETHLDLPAGGVLATPDLTRRARVVLRLAERDPFAQLGAAPHRPPQSASVTNRAVIGTRIDGQPLAVPLLGVHGVVIGSPGSGKTTTLLVLADAISACEDAVVWDLTLAGDGLRVLGPAVGRREREHAAVEDALADAVALAEVRPRIGPTVGMRGDEWEPTPHRPAVAVFIDEYPRLSKHAKELAVALLDIGRKPRVTLFAAATQATSDALGAAIASTTGLKILHSCRFEDIKLTIGPGRAAEGWRPDRLHPATVDTEGDAGQCYVSTGGLREPILSKIAPLDHDHATRQGQQRADAGIPRIDIESWNAARTWRSANATDTSTDQPPGVDIRRVTDVITVFDDDHRLWTETLLARLIALNTHYTDTTAEDLAALLRPLGIRPRDIKQGGIGRKGYYRDEITTALAAWKTGGQP